jgi:hypothetical protein
VLGAIDELVAQRRRHRREVALGDRQHPAVVVVGIGGGQHRGPGGPDDADAAATSVQRVAAGGLVEVPQQQDAAGGAFGQRCQLGQHTADVLVPVGVDLARQVRHQHVDDDERGADRDDGPLDIPHVGEGHGSGSVLPVVVGVPDRGQRVHPAGVGAGRVEPRPDRVGQAVLGRQHDDVPGRAGSTVGPGRAGGDACGEVHGQRGLPDGRVPVEDDELPGGEPAGPQPRHALGDYRGEGDQGRAGQRRVLSPGNRRSGGHRHSLGSTAAGWRRRFAALLAPAELGDQRGAFG